MALETWFCPSSVPGIPASPKVGPGNVSPDLTRIPDPWDVLRFAGGYLTVDTEDAHYPDWRKWLDATAPAYGLRIVTEAEAEAAADPSAIPCPVSETCDWKGPAAGRSQHILAHRPGADYYEPPKTTTLGTAY
jgi:hypothetical protein